MQRSQRANTRVLLGVLFVVFVGTLAYAYATSQALIGQQAAHHSDFLYFCIHVASLTAAAVGILWADRSAFEWMRGNVQTIKPRRLLQLHWLVTVALVGIIGSGLLMF